MTGLEALLADTKQFFRKSGEYTGKFFSDPYQFNTGMGGALGLGGGYLAGAGVLDMLLLGGAGALAGLGGTYAINKATEYKPAATNVYTQLKQGANYVVGEIGDAIKALFNLPNSWKDNAQKLGEGTQRALNSVGEITGKIYDAVVPRAQGLYQRAQARYAH